MKDSPSYTITTNTRKYSQESYHPYSRQSSVSPGFLTYQSSSSSSSASNYSYPSPSSLSSPTGFYPTHHHNHHLTDRLRQYVPEVPKDQLSYQEFISTRAAWVLMKTYAEPQLQQAYILLQTLSHVVKLEQQLENLEAETRKLRHLQHHHKYTNCRQSTSSSSLQNQDADRIVPEDLANVDVSEFKHLVLSSPLEYPNYSY